ncbi:DUF998 domain-containing protein [Hamadaea tsunoensis]|uniref:DUF998 domain-containing protein n=1 Tax=Hamadaea tsunoensis TaxID=53368 RepID=UPI00040BF6F1|nr:DUF998 domain-containing protein [Hamadaea tsunoensis]
MIVELPPVIVPARRLARLAGLGLVVAAVSTLAGHLAADPGLTAWGATISDYAAADRGGAVETGMFLCGLSSLLLLVALHLARQPLTWLASAGMGVWSAGLLIAAYVPTDPLGEPLSMNGQIHRYASVTAFVALVIACVSLGRRLGEAAWLRVLTAVAGTAGVAMLVSAEIGHRVMIGAAERILTAAQILALILLAVRVSRQPQDH